MPTTRVPTRRPSTSYVPATALARDADEMRNRIRRFFEAPFGTLLHSPTGADDLTPTLGWRPAFEVSEDEQAYVVTAELPGMKREDVRVEFENGLLVIEGEKEEEQKEKDAKRRYHLWERTYGSFQRSFELPKIDEHAISAEMTDGVLTVRLPKAAKTKSTVKRIEIGGKKN